MTTNTNGLLDLTETDSEPADTEPGVADAIAGVRPAVSNRPENVRFGSTPVSPGSCIKLVDGDQSRSRVGVAVASVASGVTSTTLAYLSDRWTDPVAAGGMRYLEGVQLPVINAGSEYLVLETTSSLFVTVPASATDPVYVSFYTESYSAA
jgi:hypothetical protein